MTATVAKTEDDYKVHIINENDGSTITIGANNGTLISEIIAEMYTDFALEHKADDRLRCRTSGTDVYQFADQHLRKYIEDGNCPELKWAFAGATGGA